MSSTLVQHEEGDFSLAGQILTQEVWPARLGGFHLRACLTVIGQSRSEVKIMNAYANICHAITDNSHKLKQSRSFNSPAVLKPSYSRMQRRKEGRRKGEIAYLIS